MRKRLSIYIPALIAAVLLALVPGILRAQATNTAAGLFDQCAGGSSQCNNALIHGVATTGAGGYASITTGLASVADCVLTVKKSSAPTTGGTVLTAIFTTGSAVLEINAWQPTSSSVTTLISATAAASVSYSCVGSKQ